MAREIEPYDLYPPQRVVFNNIENYFAKGENIYHIRAGTRGGISTILAAYVNHYYRTYDRIIYMSITKEQARVEFKLTNAVGKSVMALDRFTGKFIRTLDKSTLFVITNYNVLHEKYTELIQLASKYGANVILVSSLQPELSENSIPANAIYSSWDLNPGIEALHSEVDMPFMDANYKKENTMENRTLHIHKISPASKELTITVMDEKGQGGAHHRYEIDGMEYHRNPSDKDFPGTYINPPTDGDIAFGRSYTEILFQNGPMLEVNKHTNEPNGVNGITEQALLAIIIDRYESFQAGPFRCEENANALLNLKQALHWMNARTIDRIARGVEGTNAK